MIPNSWSGFDFGLGADIDMLRDSVGRFSQDRIAPRARTQPLQSQWITGDQNIIKRRIKEAFREARDDVKQTFYKVRRSFIDFFRDK